MAEVTIRIEVDIIVSVEDDGSRRVETISLVGDDNAIFAEPQISHWADKTIIAAFEDQISEALVWARSDDVAAAADAKNEGSV